MAGTACAVLALLRVPALAAEDLDRVRVESTELRFEWRGEFSPGEKARIREWMDAVVEAARGLHGELPRPVIRLAFQPVEGDPLYPGAGSSPVPFARVLRETPQGILFYVNPASTLAELVEDWTAYHEFSHLFIPFPGRSDIWFSEGLASYYQNILRHRAGILSADRARSKLVAGFRRGRADTGNADLTLAELSPRMRTERAFMRVYWSGALYFLEADLALREAEVHMNGIGSLDDVLRAFGECCLADRRRWSGRELAREFDRIAGRDLFVPLFERYAASRAIPDFEELVDPDRMNAVFAPRE